MRVIITGGTGFLGRMLSADLVRDGHEVIALSRSPERYTGRLPGGTSLVAWDGHTGRGWEHLIDGSTALVNLAGASISGDGFFPSRWSDGQRKVIRESRIAAGQAVVKAIEAAGARPFVVVQSSAVGYYGFSGDEIVTEEAPPGSDFMASVCVDWENSTAALDSMGVRRPVIRTGLPLHPQEGVMARLLLPFRLFAGGPMGDGKQWYPWIHIQDFVRAVRWLMDEKPASGPYNLSAPNPVTNRELARLLGRVMGRPSFMPVPGFAMKLAFGEVADLVLRGQRVVPERLQQAGFRFEFPEAEPALRALLKK